jgi:hypothetical protein
VGGIYLNEATSTVVKDVRHAVILIVTHTTHYGEVDSQAAGPLRNDEHMSEIQPGCCGQEPTNVKFAQRGSGLCDSDHHESTISATKSQLEGPNQNVMVATSKPSCAYEG